MDQRLVEVKHQNVLFRRFRQLDDRLVVFYALETPVFGLLQVSICQGLNFRDFRLDRGFMLRRIWVFFPNLGQLVTLGQNVGLLEESFFDRSDHASDHGDGFR